MAMDKDVLTTGEVAKICNVAPRTVSKWFDSGQLKGYKIPGSKDRRIPKQQLIKFMQLHGIPLDGITSGSTRVLIVDDEKEVTDALQKVLTEQAKYEVKVAASTFAAGLECERFKPHVILLDLHLADNAHMELVNRVRQEDDLAITKIIAMSGKMTDAQLTGLKNTGFETYLKKPFQIRQVIQAVEQCMSVVY
jgi:excisionase family DNA binding protein